MKVLSNILIVALYVLALYGVMALAIGDPRAFLAPKPSPTATPWMPKVVVEAMEAGVLYCPEATSVYTRTAIYGFVVFCK